MPGQLNSSYNTTAGNREDILDLIQQISPEETPIFSRLKDCVAASTVHVWVQDTLATATANAQVEGFTANAATVDTRSRKQNYTQILAQTGAISGTEEVINKVDVDSEYAYQVKKSMKQWKLDAENVLIVATSAAGATATARTMTGLQDSIQTNRVTGSAGGTQLSETIFNNLLQTIFESGTVPKVCFVNGWLKRKISAFSTSNTRQADGSAGKLVNMVSVYMSDFGTIEIMLDRYLPKGNGIIMNDEMFKKAWLRKPYVKPLAEVGDLKQFLVVGEFTLEYLNEKAGGILSAFATS